MAIVETKVDDFMSLVFEKKQLTSKEAAKELGVDEAYVRKLAYLFQKRKLIDLKTSLTTLTIMAIDAKQEEEPQSKEKTKPTTK